MKINSEFTAFLRKHWENVVDAGYLYRGMSGDSLQLDSAIILDPERNPLLDLLPDFLEYSEFLLNLVNNGLKFQVDDYYVEPLEKVLGWTVRDIKNPGIDFTTNYADAVAYAFNYAGSQIQHNFKIIVNTICNCEGQGCLNEEQIDKLRKLTEKMRGLLKLDQDSSHIPVVIKVKRSAKSFEDLNQSELNVGGWEFFEQRARGLIEENKIVSVERLAFFLHQKSQTANFDVHLMKPLENEGVEIITF